MNKKIPTKEGELIKQGSKIKTNKKIETVKELFESEILAEFINNSGQYLILPKGTKILIAIKSLLKKYLQKELGFEEVILPKMAPVDSFRKADILGRWDDYLLSVKPFFKTNGVKEEYILDPLQCTVFYQFFENKKIDVSEKPLKWFDASGPTFRNEDLDKIFPSVKQREFHRSEFVYLGTEKQVIEIRELCLKQIEKLCDDLGLKYRIVVGNGCYQLKDGELKFPESIREIPIKDLEIFCPGYKNKDGEEYLEVVGSSILANTMTSRFNIKGENDEELWSGCTGIGLNRLMYALITNYGTKLKHMPEKIKEVMK
ncbi:MAG: aminoacyl--tRNA ligase-related protein [Nanoarchaeota archaeon]|nr:hypothetical protein [Nanoarchaeota archaeon]MBU1030659.1 hypothetical protein [Nanoarchaeota archaeon]MBU1850314.1 hypothetical protein [Nanoarchaeota archaeon]